MDAKTLEALKASIEKWEMNEKTARDALHAGTTIARGMSAKHGVIGTGTNGCPLCDLFSREEECGDCPVALKGKVSCEGTPYWDVYQATKGGRFHSSEALVAACEAEVAFLRSLLPAEG